MASNIAFNSIGQPPRELCRFVLIESLIKKNRLFFSLTDIFFPMHVDTVINVIFLMIEPMLK